MIIDSHTHIYPDKIALKASKGIENFYEMPVRFDGTVSKLLELSDRAGITRSLVHSVATTPEQVTHINDFLISAVNAQKGRFIGFCAMHQDFPDPGREIDRMIDAGFKGIKLHPDFQRFMIDDECAFPIYEAAEGRVPILIHMGDTRYEYSKARRLYNVIQKFPRLQFIGAHFGGYSEWHEAADILQGTGIYVDTSSSLEWLDPDETRKLIDIYGVEHVLYASDYPMWDPGSELERLLRTPMTDDERELILHGNAERLLNLS